MMSTPGLLAPRLTLYESTHDSASDPPPDDGRGNPVALALAGTAGIFRLGRASAAQ